jgi:3-isopropylmalate/(R)-2-methylmalate dehydratase small subunit
VQPIIGIVLPLMEINIDTDQIIPGEWLFRGLREGYGPGLFANRRDHEDGTEKEEFILNQEPWRHATILLAGRNFGCGSSREEAPVALREYGFRAVIAPKFASMFWGNCFRNSVLPVELPSFEVEELYAQVKASGGYGRVGVDLDRECVTAPNAEEFHFETPPRYRRMLLEGIDEIGLTMTYLPVIEGFRAVDCERRPWAYLNAESDENRGAGDGVHKRR